MQLVFNVHSNIPKKKLLWCENLTVKIGWVSTNWWVDIRDFPSLHAGGGIPWRAQVQGSILLLWSLHRRCLRTVYPKKYAHGFVVLCFVVVMQSFIMNSHEVFIHIHQDCFAGTGAIVRLPQCQWSKPDGYGKFSQCITTTKHSKAKTVCIFLGIYCRSSHYPYQKNIMSITNQFLWHLNQNRGHLFKEMNRKYRLQNGGHLVSPLDVLNYIFCSFKNNDWGHVFVVCFNFV